MLDDKGREWAGDLRAQRILTDRIMRIIDGKDVVDIAGALGTIIANMICDFASSEESALRGLEQFHGDMRNVVKARFAKKGAVN